MARILSRAFRRRLLKDFVFVMVPSFLKTITAETIKPVHSGIAVHYTSLIFQRSLSQTKGISISLSVLVSLHASLLGSLNRILRSVGGTPTIASEEVPHSLLIEHVRLGSALSRSAS